MKTDAIGVEPAAGAGDPREALLNAWHAQVRQPAVRSHATMDIPATGETVTSTTEYVAPDRVRIVKADKETIAIGSTTYVNEDNTGWQRADIDLSEVFALFDPEVIEEMKETVTDARFVGPDTLDGMPTLVYEHSFKMGEIKGTTKTWMGVADGLPYRTETDGEAQSVRSRVTRVNEYDPHITIEAPPVE